MNGYYVIAEYNIGNEWKKMYDAETLISAFQEFNTKVKRIPISLTVGNYKFYIRNLVIKRSENSIKIMVDILHCKEFNVDNIIFNVKSLPCINVSNPIRIDRILQITADAV